MTSPSPPPGASRPSRRPIWLWTGVGLAIVAGLIVGGLTVGRNPPEPGSSTARGVGEPAPAIELPRVGGEGTVSLASLRGKPVVVNFFASWCVPCRKEMPALQAVSERLGNRVAFLGVNHQDDRKGATDMLAETGVRYPAGYDPDGRIAAAYGLLGMPTTVFVAADGTILDKHVGELSQDELEQAITRLFGIT